MLHIVSTLLLFLISKKSIFILVYINHCYIVQFTRLPLFDRLTSLPLLAAGTAYFWKSRFCFLLSNEFTDYKSKVNPHDLNHHVMVGCHHYFFLSLLFFQHGVEAHCWENNKFSLLVSLSYCSRTTLLICLSKSNKYSHIKLSIQYRSTVSAYEDFSVLHQPLLHLDNIFKYIYSTYNYNYN